MNAAQPETVPAVAPETVAGLPVDKLGRAFDLAKFRTGADGLPRYDSLGRFVNRNGGAPRKSPAAPAADFSDVRRVLEAPIGHAEFPGSAPGAPEPGELIPLPADAYTEAAAGIVAGLSTAAILLMGTHVAPTSEQSIAMVRAYADAFKAYGYKPEVPPWLPPLVATSVWLGPHFSDTRSQSRLATWKQKLVSLWLWVKSWGQARRAASVAASVSASVSPGSP